MFDIDVLLDLFLFIVFILAIIGLVLCCVM